MPYLKKVVCTKGGTFVYKHYAYRYGKRLLRGRNKQSTPPHQKEINKRIARDKQQWIMLENFKKGDWWVTFTYTREKRPNDINDAIKNTRLVLSRLRRALKKQGSELSYMQKTTRGEKGAIHHHFIFKSTFPIGILNELWSFGKVDIVRIYTESLTELSGYFAREEKETRYSHSKNLVIPEPVTRVIRAGSWRKEPEPKAGWEICELFNGYHDKTGYEFQKYIMRMIC